jgi:hypothetical protein
MLSLFTLRSLLQLSKRTCEFRLTGSSTPGRTSSRSQLQLVDLVADRFGRAGPIKLPHHDVWIKPRGRGRLALARHPLCHMVRGSAKVDPQYGQDRHLSRPVPFLPARRHPPGSPDPRRSPSVRQSLTPPLACSRSSSNVKALALTNHRSDYRAARPNWQKPAATTGYSSGNGSLRRLARRPLSVYCEIEGHDRG